MLSLPKSIWVRLFCCWITQHVHNEFPKFFVMLIHNVYSDINSSVVMYTQEDDIRTKTVLIDHTHHI